MGSGSGRAISNPKPTKMAYDILTIAKHNVGQHNSCSAYERELNAPIESFTTNTTRCNVQFCSGTISNLCSASAVNQGLRLRRGARDIDMYRYCIQQVRQTLISQTELANRRITGERVECTSNVYLAQELFS